MFCSSPLDTEPPGYQPRVAGDRWRGDTGGVSAADAVAGLVAIWLVLGVLTAAGARHRGRQWHLALLGGLLFPATWVLWYLIDGRLGRKAGG
jgi:hypothetical protein